MILLLQDSLIRKLAPKGRPTRFYVVLPRVCVYILRATHVLHVVSNWSLIDIAT